MSWYASAWAEKAPVGSVYERAILTYLAHRARKDGSNCYPSTSTLADFALCDKRTVQRHLNTMIGRGLIGKGDQSVVQHLRADRRPTVYDLMIPHDWFSNDQLTEINEDRAERDLPPLKPEDRPRLTPPPAKTERADKGQSNPKRSSKNMAMTSDDETRCLRDTPSEPVGNSVRDVSQTPRTGERGGTETPGRGDSVPPETVLRETPPERETPPQDSDTVNARETADARLSEQPPVKGAGGNPESEDDYDGRCRTVAQSLLRAAAEQHPAIDALDNAGKRELFDLAVAALYREVAGATLREQLTEDLADVRDVVAVLRTRLHRLASSRPSTSTPKTWRPRQERRELADEHIVGFFASDRRFVPSRFKTEVEVEAAQPAPPADPDAALAALDELLTQKQEASKAGPESTHTV